MQPAEGPDAEFLRTYSASHFRRPSVTVDVVLLCEGDPPSVFLRQRASPPFAGAWACPGSFVRMDEALEESARRVLPELDGLTAPPALQQIGCFGGLDRDPRTRVITTAYLARVGTRVETKRGAWFELREEDGRVTLKRPGVDAPTLAFDHAHILLAALRLVEDELRPAGGTVF